MQPFRGREHLRLSGFGRPWKKTAAMRARFLAYSAVSSALDHHVAASFGVNGGPSVPALAGNGVPILMGYRAVLDEKI
jgi:hypothetical protein